jgi:hypothetical protein
MSSYIYYSNQDTPETWHQETSWYQFKIIDSMLQRTRLLTILLAAEETRWQYTIVFVVGVKVSG